MPKYHEYFVYILKCSDFTYYVGVTNNVHRRIQEHQSGEIKTAYTYNRRPLELVYYTSFSNIDKAIEFEKQIKKWSKKKKEALINEEYELLPNLSKKKFD